MEGEKKLLLKLFQKEWEVDYFEHKLQHGPKIEEQRE